MIFKDGRGGATGACGCSSPRRGDLPPVEKFRKLRRNFELNYLSDDLNAPGFFQYTMFRNSRALAQIRSINTTNNWTITVFNKYLHIDFEYNCEIVL